MRIITIEPFNGVPDGESKPRGFAIGDTVTGQLAKVALAQKWAEPEPRALKTLAARQKAEEDEAKQLAAEQAALEAEQAKLAEGLPLAPDDARPLAAAAS
jgi:hypothetical protein